MIAKFVGIAARERELCTELCLEMVPSKGISLFFRKMEVFDQNHLE